MLDSLWPRELSNSGLPPLLLLFNAYRLMTRCISLDFHDGFNIMFSLLR